jgi:hypothetical protein
MWNPFRRKKKSLNNNKPDLDPIEQSRLIVNSVFYPQIKKDLDKINAYLKEHHSVQVGIEINWFFEKIED